MKEMRATCSGLIWVVLFQVKNAKRAVKFLSLESLKKRCSDTYLPETERTKNKIIPCNASVWDLFCWEKKGEIIWEKELVLQSFVCPTSKKQDV